MHDVAHDGFSPLHCLVLGSHNLDTAATACPTKSSTSPCARAAQLEPVAVMKGKWPMLLQSPAPSKAFSYWHMFAVSALRLAVSFFPEEFCHNDVGSCAKCRWFGAIRGTGQSCYRNGRCSFANVASATTLGFHIVFLYVRFGKKMMENPVIRLHYD